MPTINELPVATSVSPADEVLVSQGGVTRTVSVGSLLAGNQPAIMAPTGSLLGRVSLGPGGPESITVGTGLVMLASTVQANGADHASFAPKMTLQTTDQAVLSSDGTPTLLPLSILRGLFSAGTNVTIDDAGVISAAGGSGGAGAASGSAASIAGLGQVNTLAAGDLVAVSQAGVDHAITYANLMDGETIDEFSAAAPAADSDVLPVGQGTSMMLAQTFGAVWTWTQGKLPLYKLPVVEIATNTTLDSSAHNGRVLVCSSTVTLAHSGTEGSGFSCTLINASSGIVTLDSGITTTSGVNTLGAGQMARIHCVTYSGGTATYAWMSGPAAPPVPGQVTGISVSSVTYSSIALSWSAPSGAVPSGYTVQYRVTGSNVWSSLASSVTNATIFGLLPAVAYDIQVFATNTAGNGTASAISNATTATAPTSAPGQVTGLATSAPSASSMTLAWVAPTYGGAVGTYTAQYRVTGQSTWITAASGIAALGTIVTGLTSSTGYDFQVYAVNSTGSGMPSTVANGVTTVAAPGIPSALLAGTATQSSVPMSWTAPASGGMVASYTLQYRVTGTGSWTQVAAVPGTTTTMTGLAAGTSYDVQVAAVNAGGISAFTATTNAITLVAAPGLPTGLTAGTATSSTQVLSWTAALSGGPPTTYSVRYSVHGGNSWTAVTGITNTNVAISGLTGSTSYDYQIESVNAGGNSGWTAAVTNSTAAPSNYLLSAVTPDIGGPHPPTGYTASHGTNGIVAQINDNSSASDGSHTVPASVDFAWSASGSVQPTTGMQATYQYTFSGHNLWVQYINGATTAGTWYLWAIALDSTSTVQATAVQGPYTFT